eukprot:CAMPEP_0206443648 /NCGR_PEP_ID=MMETSP0324_2-20121206/14481_1 /ASSEMBLY_ACC=CAM_ASM_000836 /TAXON_ID=2866 /ORGANISM="Crypthecodinium cohnii, Strain Seligo" /LENGTH=929 /DNA_ID=CAMNT_0053911599 /DNA_START=66 /DNA_END=2855 /DNA_ORIENTATION=+
MPALVKEEKEEPLICCSVADEPAEDGAKLEGTNKAYYDAMSLAISLAGWVTLFGLPVYSEYISWAIFGRKELCGGANKLGWKTNIGTEDHPDLVNLTPKLIAQGYELYAWCGVLPASYFAAWPGVVQTMIFTVTNSSGTTTKLAWQGIAGTFLSVLNVYIMSAIWPMGGADPSFSPIYGYLNLTVVLFLFLATKADTNTMMLGMSTTIGLMIHFMNPNTPPTIGTWPSPIPGINWDGETTVTMLSCTAGCLLSIVATILPKPVMSIRSVHTDAVQIIKGIDEIFSAAIEYWAADSPGPKRFQIYAKMNSLNKAVARVGKNLEDAYWETFDIGNFGRIRNLYGKLRTAISSSSDEVFILKAATGCLDFEWNNGEPHQTVVQRVKPSLKKLKVNAIACLETCRLACKDGSISAEEERAIQAARDSIEAAQQELSNEFQLATNKGKDMYLSEKIAPESLFIFAVSMWAQECADFAGELKGFEAEYGNVPFINRFKNFFKAIAVSLVDTFNPTDAFSPAQLRYVLVNFLPIMGTVLVAMNIDGTVFVQYSSTMPGLLAYLVTKDHFIPFMKNAQRLTGVTFGHTMPLLVMSVVQLLPCDSCFRFAFHMGSIFMFYVTFNFMNFASLQWSGVGLTIAAFGIYPLFRQCSPDSLDDNFGAHYKAIAQTIVAIMLKIFTSTVLADSTPRDNAVKRLTEANTLASEAMQAFYSGNVKGQGGLAEKKNALKGKLGELEAIAPLTDPKLEIVPGGRAPFKYSFLTTIIDQYKLILSDMDMLVLAVAGSDSRRVVMAGSKQIQDDAMMKKDEADFFKVLTGQEAWNTVRSDLTDTMNRTFALSKEILSHDTEKPLKGEVLEKMNSMTKVTTLEGISDFYTQVHASVQAEVASKSQEEIVKDKRIIPELRRTRLMVAMNAMSLLVQHTAVIIGEGFNRMES